MKINLHYLVYLLVLGLVQAENNVLKKNLRQNENFVYLSFQHWYNLRSDRWRHEKYHGEALWDDRRM